MAPVTGVPQHAEDEDLGMDSDFEEVTLLDASSRPNGGGWSASTQRTQPGLRGWFLTKFRSLSGFEPLGSDEAGAATRPTGTFLPASSLSSLVVEHVAGRST